MALAYQYNEDEDDEGLTKKHRDTVLVLFLPVLVQLVGNRLFETTELLSARQIDFKQWSGNATGIIQDGHETAYGMGMLKAGVLPSTEQQKAAAAAVVQEQHEFFQSLRRDILDGRYTNPDGSLRVGPINTRLGNYAKRLKGTANRGWYSALPASEEFRWDLCEKEHCMPREGFDFTCPEIHARGWMKKEDVPTLPGECKTPCFFNCGCGIETRSGETGF